MDKTTYLKIRQAVGWKNFNNNFKNKEEAEEYMKKMGVKSFNEFYIDGEFVGYHICEEDVD